LSCPLCRAERLTKWYHEDDVCWIADCLSHPDKKLVVLKRHARVPTVNESEHIMELVSRLFPRKRWRYPRSILDHFHLHEEGA